jgi:hypothetical protein
VAASFVYAGQVEELQESGQGGQLSVAGGWCSEGEAVGTQVQACQHEALGVLNDMRIVAGEDSLRNWRRVGSSAMQVSGVQKKKRKKARHMCSLNEGAGGGA